MFSGAIMLSGQYGQQISETYRGGSECAFTPINYQPLSKNYIILFSHWTSGLFISSQCFITLYAISTLWLDKFGSDLKL